MAVAAFMLGVEALPQRRGVAGEIPGCRTGIGDRVLLAAIAQVGGEGEFCARLVEAVARERRLAGARAVRQRPRGLARRKRVRVRRSGCARNPAATAAISMPSAEKFPGSFGTITVGMAISRAIAAACSGPAPPKAMIAASRGSMPRLTETARTASDIAPSAIGSDPAGRGRRIEPEPCRRF